MAGTTPAQIISRVARGLVMRPFLCCCLFLLLLYLWRFRQFGIRDGSGTASCDALLWSTSACPCATRVTEQPHSQSRAAEAPPSPSAAAKDVHLRRPPPIDWSTVKPSTLNLWQSTVHKHLLADKVAANLALYAPDYTRYLVDDDDILAFMRKFGYEQYIPKFESFYHGAHKADFFRYMVLYRFGGCWIDEDVEPLSNFTEVFKHRENVLYSVLVSYTYAGKKEPDLKIFQAILSVPPGHELMRAAYLDLARTDHDTLKYDHTRPTSQLYELLRRRLPPGSLRAGEPGRSVHRPIKYSVPAVGWPVEEPWGPRLAEEDASRSMNNKSMASISTTTQSLLGGDPRASSEAPEGGRENTIYLFAEKCQNDLDAHEIILRERLRKRQCCDMLDRYGSCCFVVGPDGQKLFRSRYVDYPWGAFRADGTPAHWTEEEHGLVLGMVRDRNMTTGEAIVSVQSENDRKRKSWFGLGKLLWNKLR